ncbi:hypothetical protein FKM82_025760 [Ascaphus truei]
MDRGSLSLGTARGTLSLGTARGALSSMVTDSRLLGAGTWRVGQKADVSWGVGVAKELQCFFQVWVSRHSGFGISGHSGPIRVSSGFIGEDKV